MRNKKIYQNMKKLFYISLLFLPVIAFTQINRVKSYPLDFLWKYVGSAGFSDALTSFNSFKFSPGGDPYMAFEENAYSGKAIVMKYDGTNWINVGDDGFSAGIAYWIKLAFSSASQPFVAYSDSANHQKTTVMKFDGTSWVNVGNAGFSAGQADAISLVLSPSDEPYVAY